VHFVPLIERVALLEAIAVSDVRVLYLPDFGVDNMLLSLIGECVVRNKRILALNLGETSSGISAEDWQRFANSIARSNVSFLFVEPNAAGPDVVKDLKVAIRNNRLSCAASDWMRSSMEPLMSQVSHMFWQPKTSKYLGTLLDC
jgi:hypothetical protein